ncbi:TetR/AcrR family transcriptional regulator (plasmid) [Deinococcus sp. KNUC1210]|uniref:TetR/AcrR family transcriptional regulator n=1 Tax=Deinococcus sp. KNUC1210 TaxID=2917691 RepID=UPI001EEFEC69|nr:TetR/AcrR family transcriptional regulator [Deinococcus sp. KNUC1210]ULH18065.1 TetR/AcrR family transcriptional regulator [Deinococcus sp. KNUC1210]
MERGQRASTKRDEIVAAALGLYRTFGVGGTTLKDVSDASRVPLGNLYYYFKTRSRLVLAVLDKCEHELQTLLKRLSVLSPAAWLAAYFEWLLADPATAARFGCPFGALALELRALSDPAAERAAEIVETYFRAVSAQISALGLAPAFADDLFTAVQGSYAVARVRGDAAFFQASIQRLRDRTLHAIGAT